MIPSKSPSTRSRVELAPEHAFSSFADEDMALMFYTLLDDEDLEEVFGDFYVPVQPDA
jgi:hypothetical protein